MLLLWLHCWVRSDTQSVVFSPFFPSHFLADCLLDFELFGRRNESCHLPVQWGALLDAKKKRREMLMIAHQKINWCKGRKHSSQEFPICPGFEFHFYQTNTIKNSSELLGGPFLKLPNVWAASANLVKLSVERLRETQLRNPFNLCSQLPQELPGKCLAEPLLPTTKSYKNGKLKP